MKISEALLKALGCRKEFEWGPSCIRILQAGFSWHQTDVLIHTKLSTRIHWIFMQAFTGAMIKAKRFENSLEDLRITHAQQVRCVSAS